jgi:predicted nucleotidyltransferase
LTADPEPPTLHAMPQTVHPGVPIASLTDALTAALGSDLVGLYAYGSAVSGGFDPGVSDIDLVAVTERIAADLDLQRLDRVHGAFVAAHPDWEDRLEIVYIGAGTLRAFRTSDTDLAVISPGEPLHLSRPVRDWVQNWYLARETGVTLVGTAAGEVIPEISREEFLSAVASYAGWLATQDLEALSAGALAYAVLSECRALCTLRTCKPRSKQEGAAWVTRFEPHRTALVEAALACRLSRGAAGFDDEATRAAAAAFVRSTAATCARG